MLARCYYPGAINFSRYGGRGITVAEEWKNDFAKFLEDMGPKPSPKHSIERKDNDLGYSRDNCIWATSRQQSRNRSDSKRITAWGVSQTTPAWAEQTGVKRDTILHRLAYGWSPERALAGWSPWGEAFPT